MTAVTGQADHPGDTDRSGGAGRSTAADDPSVARAARRAAGRDATAPGSVLDETGGHPRVPGDEPPARVRTDARGRHDDVAPRGRRDDSPAPGQRTGTSPRSRAAGPDVAPHRARAGADDPMAFLSDEAYARVWVDDGAGRLWGDDDEGGREGVSARRDAPPARGDAPPVRGHGDGPPSRARRGDRSVRARDDESSARGGRPVGLWDDGDLAESREAPAPARGHLGLGTDQPLAGQADRYAAVRDDAPVRGRREDPPARARRADPPVRARRDGAPARGGRRFRVRSVGVPVRAREAGSPAPAFGEEDVTAWERGDEAPRPAPGTPVEEAPARGWRGERSRRVLDKDVPVPAHETYGRAVDSLARGRGAETPGRRPEGDAPARVRGDGGHPRAQSPRPADEPRDADDGGRAGERPGIAWDDGFIARRLADHAGPDGAPPANLVERRGAPRRADQPDHDAVFDVPLRERLDALRELVGLSRARLDGATLAEAVRVLDEAAARRRLSGGHTVVALAGATGSGKSSLFNALAGANISHVGVRRPTTAAPLACSWADDGGALLDRLGVPARQRRKPLQNPTLDDPLRGLILVDLPDHDSAAVSHREQVDRVLALVDAVIWVVDPEKYADAVLHDRYLRPMAGHAEVMFVVLNQVDRLPGDATDQVLDDLRRLLDEDGVALGEYEEPGAVVLAASAATGRGVPELREALGQFVAERGAAARRIAADVDAAAARLRSVYAAARHPGLTEEAREEFTGRLAEAVGAAAAGQAAERAWRRNAGKACGTPWLRLWRWYGERRDPAAAAAQQTPVEEEATARQRVEQAVRTVADRAATGLPTPWGQAVREAAVRGARGLPEALDALAVTAGVPQGRPPRPAWWPVAVLAQAAMTLLQIVGGLWLIGQIVGICTPHLALPVFLMILGIGGGPFIEWACRLAARGPARRYGLDAERRLREAAAGCGRARVLDPVAAELLRYAEVREQYVRVQGAATVGARVG